jgi:Lysozyme like domain
VTVVSDEQIAALASKCWKGQDQVISVAVALAESGGDNDASNYCCHCLWQVNVLAHKQYNAATLISNPIICVTAACAIQKTSGWGAWQTYSEGTYKQFLPRAEKAVKEWSGSSPGQGAEEAGIFPENVVKHVESGVSSVTKSLTAPFALEGKLLSFLTSKGGILRAVKVVGGGVLLIIAANELVKLGGNTSTGPIEATTKAAKKAGEATATVAASGI